MHKKAFIFLMVLAASLLMATVASAVVWGEPDGDRHPYVGVVGLKITADRVGTCSGTLIAPRLVLTAGHCTALAFQGARFWTASDLTTNPEFPGPGATSVEGQAYTHPGYYAFDWPNSSDVGVVVLDEPIYMAQYGQLPGVNAVGQLYSENHPPPVMNIVGYGLQRIIPDRERDFIRYQGISQIIELNSANTGGYNIHLGSNPGLGQGAGGSCFGDSGGPALLSASSNIIGGVSSSVLNQNCAGGSLFYRVDTAHVLDWITGSFGEHLP